VSSLPPIKSLSRFQQPWEIASDLLIVALLIYGLPLLVGLGVILVRLAVR
jgi:hypothetical protein